MISTGHCRLFGHGPGPSHDPERPGGRALPLSTTRRPTCRTVLRRPGEPHDDRHRRDGEPGRRRRDPGAGSDGPYRVDADGRPYVPVGDGGIVLGVRLGDGVFATDATTSRPAPASCTPTRRPARADRLRLRSATWSRSAPARRPARRRGARQARRGRAGSSSVFEPERARPARARRPRWWCAATARARDGPVRCRRHGAQHLTVRPGPAGRSTSHRRHPAASPSGPCVPSQVVGNGIGRPAQQWDLDLSVDAGDRRRAGGWPGCGSATWSRSTTWTSGTTPATGAAGLTVGLVVHGGSPQPGHGPGVMPILCAPTSTFDLQIDGSDHVGVSRGRIQFGRD